MQAVRPAAVAGLFYPGRRAVLRSTIAELLDDARRVIAASSMPAPKGLVLPHAGYVYSGSTAALGYALLERERDSVHRVVLLGPCHRVWTEGLALPDAGAFETPLGTVAVERVPDALRRRLPQLHDGAAVHAQEHSLEVHVPFLQTVLGEFTLVPLAVGAVTAEQVSGVIDALWGGPETVVVASSDLSHYLTYQQANAVDADTVAKMLRLDPTLTHDEACGADPVNGLLLSARTHGLAPRLLGRCNSGDTAGDKRRVVGYAALALAS